MNVNLLVVQGKPAGKRLGFGPGEFYLGRGPECQVRFNSDWVSRQHCLLRVGPATASLRDLSSRNGTLVNGTLIREETPLADRDLVQVGPVTFEVRIDSATQGGDPGEIPLEEAGGGPPLPGPTMPQPSG